MGGSLTTLMLYLLFKAHVKGKQKKFGVDFIEMNLMTLT